MLSTTSRKRSDKPDSKRDTKKSDKSDKSDRTKTDKSDKSDKSDRTKTDKSDRTKADHKNKSDRSKSGRDKSEKQEKSDRSEKSEKQEKSDRSERKHRSTKDTTEPVPIHESVPENTENIENIEDLSTIEGDESESSEVVTHGFIFVYEANGVYYTNLNDIDKTDGRMVVIHPLYYDGYNNNLTSEEVVYDKEQDKYVSASGNGSWLDVLYGSPDVVFFTDLKTVVLYDGVYYHCDGCLVNKLTNYNLTTIDLQ